MKSIKAKVSEVLDILKKNRELHHDIFIAAQKIYRSEVIRKLDQALQSAKDGKEFPSYIQIPEPEDHTKDYDRVIRMLELSTEETIELSEQEVEVYVMDRWSWSHNWAASNIRYLNDEAITNAMSCPQVSSSYAVTGSAGGKASYSSLFGGTGVKSMQSKLGEYL